MNPRPLLIPAPSLSTHKHPNPTTDVSRPATTMQQPPEQAQQEQARDQLPEQERQQALIELMQRGLFRASDEEILGKLESPSPPMTQGDVAATAMASGRGGLVLPRWSGAC